MKLTELQSKNPELYCTDKFGASNKWVSHAYGEFYDEYFEKIKNKKLDVLEIGIYTGGSVRLFHDYLKNSNIYGVDIQDIWNAGDEYPFPRLQRRFFNAYDMGNWKKLPIDKFDIIIDDGPHTYDSQLFALNNFYSMLKPNGILIVEDVPTAFLTKLLTESIHKSNEYIVHNWESKTKVNDDIIIAKIKTT